MHRIYFLLLAVLIVVISGCSQSQIAKDSWKFTTRQYRAYLNKPVSVDMEDRGNCELYELALGEAVLNVDSELAKLIRAMENSDYNPDQQWVMGMMSRLPWLSGVAIVDKNGALVARYPEYFAKEFDASPLLELDPKQRMGDLRAYVQLSDAGPEVYVANPVYRGEELQGIITAFFDPRALVSTSSDPGSFILTSPAGVIWPGRYGSDSFVSAQNWEEILTKESCGIIGDDKTGFFWTTRYLGNLPIVYAMPVSAGQTRNNTPQAATEEAAAFAGKTAASTPAGSAHTASPADSQVFPSGSTD